MPDSRLLRTIRASILPCRLESIALARTFRAALFDAATARAAASDSTIRRVALMFPLRVRKAAFTSGLRMLLRRSQPRLSDASDSFPSSSSPGTAPNASRTLRACARSVERPRWF